MNPIVNLEKQIEELFEELIELQNKKTLEAAQIKIPHITCDDILNPQDFPILNKDPLFNYQEGYTTGLMAAQMAIRARCFRRDV